MRKRITSYCLVAVGAIAAISMTATVADARQGSSHAVTGPGAVASGYTVASSPVKLTYPDQNVTLRPIGSDQSVGVIDAATAYAVAKDRAPLPYISDMSRTGTAALYLYSNSVAGAIQGDGSVTLEYQDTPAWVFTFPLAHYVDFGVGAASVDGVGTAGIAHSGCTWVSIVDATKSELIEAFEICKQ